MKRAGSLLALLIAAFVGLGMSKPLAASPPCWSSSPHKACAPSTTSTTTVQATTTDPTTTTTTTTTPAPAAAPPYFVGDFDTCDLSQWTDVHDADLSAPTPGFTTIASAFSGCGERVVASNYFSTSQSGDASYLWEGNGSNSYQLPDMQQGADTWFRMQVLFPDGTDASYPGTFTPQGASSAWDMVEEWHQYNMYSTYVGVCGWCNPVTLILRPSGGSGAAPTQEWIEKVPLQYNHWYDILVHQTFYPDSRGYIEWYVDGTLQYAANVPTLSIAADGSIPGASHQVGLYRGPSRTDTDTVYIDGVVDGPTRASVGG